MANFKPWDVVKVPFPYTDRPVRQYRPGLVVSVGPAPSDRGLLWVLMITSADNRGWDDDVAISDLETAGLPAPSVVRCAKIATIEGHDAERIGSLPRADRRNVSEYLARALAATATGGAARR